ncbi:MAG: hypothetical protein QXX19_03170 [Candidatus Caldarchaeum sp.]
MKYSAQTALVLVGVLLWLPSAFSQDVVVKDYGFYGAVDSRNMVTNPATVVVDGQKIGFFTTANSRAYLYVLFESIKSPYDLLFRWVGPKGEVIEVPLRSTQQGVFTSYWVWSSLAINENRSLGLWNVVVLYNNRQILEASFVLQTPQIVIDRINELLEENEKLASELEASKTEVKTLNENLAKTSGQLQQIQSEKSRLESDLRDLTDRLSKTNSELQQAQATNKQLSDKLAQEIDKSNSLEQQRLLLVAATVVAAAVGGVAAVMGRRGRSPPPPPPPPQ